MTSFFTRLKTRWRRFNPVLYFVLGQIGWFACVLSAAKGSPWIGTTVVAVMIAAHLFYAAGAVAELKLVVIVALLGAIWDSGIVHYGLLDYSSGNIAHDLAPYWIIALWALFGAQFNTTYSWLKRRKGLAALLGAIAGPISFHAGASLGALRFVKPWPATMALALGWACLLPLIAAMSLRWNGVTMKGTSHGA